MKPPKYNQAVFVLSAVAFEQLPPDEGLEVAFIGRSNAGKSSALNTITGKKGLARVSKMPGRTQAMNVFALDEQRRFIDLPGYGYAKVPLATKERWHRTINQYLQQRDSLRGLVLIMDIRHPMRDLDKQLIDWAAKCGLSVHILLTKVDKLKNAQAVKTFREVEQEIKQRYTDAQVTVQNFSSLTHSGLDEALLQLNAWLTEE